MDHIIWRHADGRSLEYCQFTFGAATAIRGTIVGELQGMRGALTYEVVCRPDGSTHWVHGRVQSERGEMSWTVRREDSGIWLVNGAPDPRLATCQDVDIGVTPATNTLPIRRIDLQVGASHAFSAAWVRFPDLTVHALAQRYTRLSSDVYRYESLKSGFQATLRVNQQGIVQDYSGLWSILSTN